MNYKNTAGFLLIVFAVLILRDGFLPAVNVMIVLTTVIYGGFFLMRWVLFWLAGVAGREETPEEKEELKRWIEENRPKAPQ